MGWGEGVRGGDATFFCIEMCFDTWAALVVASIPIPFDLRAIVSGMKYQTIVCHHAPKFY